MHGGGVHDARSARQVSDTGGRARVSWKANAEPAEPRPSPGPRHLAPSPGPRHPFPLTPSPSPLPPHRVPFAANPATVSAFSLVMNAGPVRTGAVPPPLKLPLVL